MPTSAPDSRTRNSWFNFCTHRLPSGEICGQWIEFIFIPSYHRSNKVNQDGTRHVHTDAVEREREPAAEIGA